MKIKRLVEGRVTHAKLANRAGVSQPYVTQILNGKRQLPYIVAEKIADLSGSDPLSLLYETNGQLKKRDLRQYLIYNNLRLDADHEKVTATLNDFYSGEYGTKDLEVRIKGFLGLLSRIGSLNDQFMAKIVSEIGQEE